MTRRRCLALLAVAPCALRFRPAAPVAPPPPPITPPRYVRGCYVAGTDGEILRAEVQGSEDGLAWGPWRERAVSPAAVL